MATSKNMTQTAHLAQKEKRSKCTSQRTVIIDLPAVSLQLKKKGRPAHLNRHACPPTLIRPSDLVQQSKEIATYSVANDKP